MTRLNVRDPINHSAPAAVVAVGQAPGAVAEPFPPVKDACVGKQGLVDAVNPGGRAHLDGWGNRW